MTDTAMKTGRKAPKRETVRRLFALSGNQCARPACGTVLLAAGGTLVGEICHIAAESAGGARFDPSLTPEQRRSFDNLILLCATCHALVDGERTSSRSRSCAAGSEPGRRCSRPPARASARPTCTRSRTRMTTSAPACPAASSGSASTCPHAGRTPRSTRRRPGGSRTTPSGSGTSPRRTGSSSPRSSGRRSRRAGGTTGYGVTIHPDDLKTLLIDRRPLSDTRIARLAATLDRHGLGSIDVDDRVPRLFIAAPNDGVSWTNLSAFADAHASSLDQVLRELKFGILD